MKNTKPQIVSIEFNIFTPGLGVFKHTIAVTNCVDIIAFKNRVKDDSLKFNINKITGDHRAVDHFDEYVSFLMTDPKYSDSQFHPESAAKNN